VTETYRSDVERAPRAAKRGAGDFDFDQVENWGVYGGTLTSIELRRSTNAEGE
jgi:hypothetical protein